MDGQLLAELDACARHMDVVKHAVAAELYHDDVISSLTYLQCAQRIVLWSLV
jgi:hypothetical protein